MKTKFSIIIKLIYVFLLILCNLGLLCGSIISYNIVPENPAPILEKIIVNSYLTTSICYLFYSLYLIIKKRFKANILFLIFAFSPTIIIIFWVFVDVIIKALKEICTLMDFTFWLIFIFPFLSFLLFYFQKKDLGKG